MSYATAPALYAGGRTSAVFQTLNERDRFGVLAKKLMDAIARRGGARRETPIERVALPSTAAITIDKHHDLLLQVVGLKSIEVLNGRAGGGSRIVRIVPLPYPTAAEAA